MIRRLICKYWYRKHQRGKLVSRDQTHKRFECPRCGRRTSYPVANS